MLSRKIRNLLFFLVFLCITAVTKLFSAGIEELLLLRTDRVDAIAGIIDLRDYDFEIQGMVDLSGQWDFFWEEFIRPRSKRRATTYIHSGFHWNKREEYPSRSYATYRIRILLPEKAPPFPLHIGYRKLDTAARLYWNGKHVLTIGNPAQIPHRARGAWRSGISPELHYDTDIELLVHISNYENINGGMIENLVLGGPEDIQTYNNLSTALSFLLLGILLITGTYHLFAYFHRFREPAWFWFAIASFSLGLQILTVESFSLSLFFPHISLHQQMAINYLCLTIALFAMTLFVYFSFPNAFIKVLSWVSLPGYITYSALILLTPPSFFTEYLITFKIFSAVISCGFPGIALWALFNKQPFSPSFALGILIFFASIVYATVQFISTRQLPDLNNLAIAFFIPILSLNINRRTLRALQNSELLVTQLRQTNNAMNRFIPQELLEQLSKNEITQISPGDHSKLPLTILSAGLRGFSSSDETNSPANMLEFINIFFAKAGPIIRQNRGIVAHYQKDGIVALFKEEPGRAMQAAIEIHQKIDQLNQKRAELDLKPIRMGIGIYTGECIIGTIGEERRMDGVVISAAINLCFRLQNLTRRFNAKILTSGSTIKATNRNEQFYQRTIGTLASAEGSATISIIEIINADPPEVWKEKRITRRSFQKAVTLISEGRKQEAKKLFLSCRDAAPNDAATLYYLEQLDI